MRGLLLANLTVAAMTMAGPALAADFPVKAPVPFAARWTSCYVGGNLGGAFAQKDITDPVQLVQTTGFSAATVGVTTVNPAPEGAVIGGQIGCDYEFPSSFVIGVEGSASGSTMRGSRSVALPLGNPGEAALVHANTDFLAGLTGRVGYAFDNVLLYARGGAALAGDKFEVSGTFTGLPYDFRGLDNRFGWVAGGGVDWAFSRHWSTFLEYDFYDFGHGTVSMLDGINGFSGPVNVKQNVQVVKVGFDFHVSGAGW